MKTYVLLVTALLLVLLFSGPIVYRQGERVALYLSCPYADSCWEMAGHAVMHGGRLPRR
jgi:hypothetical protein